MIGCEDGERGLLLHDALQTVVIFSSVDPQLICGVTNHALGCASSAHQLGPSA